MSIGISVNLRPKLVPGCCLTIRHRSRWRPPNHSLRGLECSVVSPDYSGAQEGSETRQKTREKKGFRRLLTPIVYRYSRKFPPHFESQKISWCWFGILYKFPKECNCRPAIQTLSFISHAQFFH